MKKTKAKKGKRLSLFTKYYIVIAATVVASLLILGSIFSAFLYDYWENKSYESLDMAVSSISSQLSTDIIVKTSLKDRTARDKITSALNVYAQMNNCDIVITDSDSTVIRTNEDFSVDSFVAAACNTLWSSGKPVEAENGKTVYNKNMKMDVYGTNVLVSGIDITMGQEIVGKVIAVKQARAFLSYMEDILRLFLFSALAALVVSVGVTYYLVYRIYKPIAQLKLATEKIGAGDYSFRVEIDGEDEFAYLGNAFNSMARDLAALEASRRNFIANISHELKTPMTTIGGYIDAMMDGTIDRDKQDHYLAIVSSEVKRLSRLVVAMLNLSKIEAGERKLEKKNVNLTQMLVEVMISFEQAIETNRIEVIGLDKIPDVIANVDRDMMYQVFYNLTDNAVKFTDPGGRIFVSLTQVEEKVGFRIVNECSGISKEDISKIFERFYKVDRSRNKDTQGFGLGLYITKTIVNMHGGQITARSREGSDCEFLFWIPVK